MRPHWKLKCFFLLSLTFSSPPNDSLKTNESVELLETEAKSFRKRRKLFPVICQPDPSVKSARNVKRKTFRNEAPRSFGVHHLDFICIHEAQQCPHLPRALKSADCLQSRTEKPQRASAFSLPGTQNAVQTTQFGPGRTEANRKQL